MADDTSNSALRFQGAYYLITGLWPVVHRQSFEAITGEKKEAFLLETAGGLFAAIGATLLAGARQHPPSQPVRTLAVLAPLVAAAAALRHRPRAVYFVDAALQAGLARRVLRSG
jgi:hypothetical protein